MTSKITRKLESKIYVIREQRIMLDRDLADLYGVETRVLVQSVKRNIDRFPDDFAFRLSNHELQNWKSQIVISNLSIKMGLRKPPWAFTEQGIAMLSSVLKSKQAIQVNIVIMRAFVEMRRMMISTEELSRKIRAIENKYDHNFKVVFEAIRQVMSERAEPRKAIKGLSE